MLQKNEITHIPKLKQHRMLLPFESELMEEGYSLTDTGLRERYISKENFRMLIKMIIYAVFLPTDNVIRFQVIHELKDNDEELDVIFYYFKDFIKY